ncbi:DinB family protein [Streptomyces sp. NPDC053560]|uniref:DinB family protein n=1 Tax=Streptomyces sp. NPDC053560 TaxID=3365711 RepID=UPI0037D2A509
MAIRRNDRLTEQLDRHWRHQLRGRLEGLTGEEYFWEPVADAHIIVGVFGMRVANHFGGPKTDYESFAYAGSAQGALEQLDAAYAAWRDGVRGLGEEGLARPCGPAEDEFAESPTAEPVLHINREAIHHGAEIALLRDLYAHR